MIYEKTPMAAAKIVAENRGVKGKAGGWLYDRHGKAIVQGWAAYTKQLQAAGIVNPIEITNPKTGEKTTRYAINWRRLRRP
jgi:hypothetical protein